MVNPVEPSSVSELFCSIIDRILADQSSNFYDFKLCDAEVEADIFSLDPSLQVKLTISLLQQCHRTYANDEERRMLWAEDTKLYRSALQILNRKLPFEQDDLVIMLNIFTQDRFWQTGSPQVLKAVGNYLNHASLTPELETAIMRFCDSVEQGGYGNTAQERLRIAKLRALIGREMTLPLKAGEAWSDRAIADLATHSTTDRALWSELLTHCTTATTAHPSQKWRQPIASWLDQLNATTVSRCLTVWFSLVDQPRTQPIAEWSQWAPNPNLLLEDTNADVLKGLLWLCPTLVELGRESGEVTLIDDLTRAIARLTQSAYRKAPGVGPRCVRLGNAGVWVLGQIPGMTAIGQLALLKAKVKFKPAQMGLDRALNAAADRAGLSREEIEELGVPTYGLETVDTRREMLGDFTAELVVTGTSSTELRWIKPDGKPQKSVPKAVKDQCAEELKELKQAAKDIQKMLPVQRDRIEAVYLQQKDWDYLTWRDRYLDRPLVGTLARRLIWWFTNTADEAEIAGIWHDGRLVDVNDRPLETLLKTLDDTTRVRLWHPLDEPIDRVLAWRTWLLDRQISQPFKQAHREIYLLTPAEENTGVYSNRFAAHIIKQHQFNALCGQRGWNNTLRLMVDDCYRPASLSLDRWNLRAEFWIEGIGDNYGVDTTEAGSYLYLATDQVRFYPINSRHNYAYAGGGGYSPSGWSQEQPTGEPIALDRIPKLVFSEVMRDVDLFVGVASVGNDPNWSDGGPEGRHLDYWQSYSFGELSATATTRRQLLETLIPRLKIRDRCSFTDRFLVVRGEIRTYKIHLGSGNILMEPNDEYLCIVPSGRQETGSSQVFLPFEGDRILSIVLSKAFLLAEDRKITDPTIVQQIKPK
jgi:Domain of unknown function (DUF4132)